VLFLGDSGKGKSTLAASFLRRGAALISDDLCAIELDRPGARILPAYPRLKLCHDAFNRLGGREAADRDPDKRVAMPDAFADTPRPLLAVVHLRTFAVHRVTMEHLAVSAARRVLDDNVYRRSLVSSLNAGEPLARSLDRLVGLVAIYRTVRPRDRDSLEELTDMVAGEIESGRLRGRSARGLTAADCTARWHQAPAAIGGRLGDRMVVRHLDEDHYVQLDPVGGRVWELLETPLTHAEVCGRLLREYEVSAADCERDVGALLTRLQAHGLIEYTS
jgi:hypothetical protein